jgi:outer membrane lipoprotein SlyB
MKTTQTNNARNMQSAAAEVQRRFVGRIHAGLRRANASAKLAITNATAANCERTITYRLISDDPARAFEAIRKQSVHVQTIHQVGAHQRIRLDVQRPGAQAGSATTGLLATMLFALVLLAAPLFALAQSTYGATTYSPGETRQLEQVRFATVLEVTAVTIEDRSVNQPYAYAGAAAGGGIGFAACSHVGQGNGRILAQTLCTLGGGAAGAELASRPRLTRATEVIIKMDDGSIRAVVQEGNELLAGDRVKVTGNWQTVRLTRTSVGVQDAAVRKSTN